MEQCWMQMINKYGEIINQAQIAQMSGMQPNLAAYHHAIGMLEGYAQACLESGAVTPEDYGVMLQYINTYKNGGSL